MLYLFHFIFIHLEIANIVLWTDAEINLCLCIWVSKKYLSSLWS